MIRRVWAPYLAILAALAAILLSAPGTRATTYIVGTCKAGTQFTKIQDALDATPAPTIVEVCPGSYPEQVTITKPVTLEGIASGNSSLATIVAPSGTMLNNATLVNGDAAAVQILVKNVSGAVNLTNLVVDGSNDEASGAATVGILYMNTPGTVNHVVPYNVTAGLGGYGIYLEGGSANPKVTVENSTIDHDETGVWVQSNSTSSELTAIIQNSLLSSCATCIDVQSGATVTISNNMINTNGEIGIALVGSTGSVTGNTIVGGQDGIDEGDAGFSIKSNKIYNASRFGINLDIAVLTADVTGNTVSRIGTVGIGFCGSSSSFSKLHSNTFEDSNIGYSAPFGFTTTGSTFIGVTTDAMIPCG
jgi:parallel beta-helix repeat protein